MVHRGLCMSSRKIDREFLLRHSRLFRILPRMNSPSVPFQTENDRYAASNRETPPPTPKKELTKIKDQSDNPIHTSHVALHHHRVAPSPPAIRSAFHEEPTSVLIMWGGNRHPVQSPSRCKRANAEGVLPTPHIRTPGLRLEPVACRLHSMLANVSKPDLTLKC